MLKNAWHNGLKHRSMELIALNQCARAAGIGGVGSELKAWRASRAQAGALRHAGVIESSACGSDAGWLHLRRLGKRRGREMAGSGGKGGAPADRGHPQCPSRGAARELGAVAQAQAQCFQLELA
jgi:hypothetical protein